ncbi:MAG: Na+/H+ antiporter NhaA type [Deltaproteobacteria bacterium]|nr:Na+/H+ antiporter NhaA type [Deltaproteobacteria bacterium]
MFVTIAAMVLKNSPLATAYNAFLLTPVEVRFGVLHIGKPLLLWINDGLMAVFFLLVGLEVKQEILQGHLSTLQKVALPGIAALGGMVLPALIYAIFNWNEPFAMRGWAIPTATDIAFSLGILSLLGKRVPVSLKIFLMALAIIDDIGAIVIIALFYTEQISIVSMIFALAALLALFCMNIWGVVRRGAYVLVGVMLWVSVLKSGVHATLAGVALAFMIPLEITDRQGKKHTPAKSFEDDLHVWAAFMILPLFAFVNAGIQLSEISIAEMLAPVPLGIMLGLFIGKQLGVFGFSWLAIRSGLAAMPEGSDWRQLYGVALLTGIGFTMSLFIDGLAFDDGKMFSYADRMAVIVGSLLSGVAGYLVLLRSGAAEVDDSGAKPVADSIS